MLKLFKLILFFFLYPLKRIITPKNLIVISSNSPYRYGGGPKYLFEYLSRKNFNCYWFTNSEEIKKYLRQRKLKFFSQNNIIEFIYVLLFAKITIDSGDVHFDFCKLIEKDKRVIKICVGHGMGPKIINEMQKHPLSYKFDFVSFTSRYSYRKIAIGQFGIKKNNIKLIGNPKNDIFFDKSKIKKYLKYRKITKFFIPNISKNSKLIFYAPTWREYKMNFPLSYLKNFSFKKFNLFLEQNNLFFFYNCHIQAAYNFEKSLSRIKFVSNKEYPLFDTNELLLEIDIFCTDCSTLSTEVALLKKPQIIIFPDYLKYNKKVGFVEPFKKIVPGKFVDSFENLTKTLVNYKNKNIYLKEYSFMVNKYLKNYYDVRIKNSSFLHKQLIQELININSNVHK